MDILNGPNGVYAIGCTDTPALWWLLCELTHVIIHTPLTPSHPHSPPPPSPPHSRTSMRSSTAPCRWPTQHRNRATTSSSYEPSSDPSGEAAMSSSTRSSCRCSQTCCKVSGEATYLGGALWVHRNSGLILISLKILPKGYHMKGHLKGSRMVQISAS